MTYSWSCSISRKLSLLSLIVWSRLYNTRAGTTLSHTLFWLQCTGHGERCRVRGGVVAALVWYRWLWYQSVLVEIWSNTTLPWSPVETDSGGAVLTTVSHVATISLWSPISRPVATPLRRHHQPSNIYPCLATPSNTIIVFVNLPSVDQEALDPILENNVIKKNSFCKASAIAVVTSFNPGLLSDILHETYRCKPRDLRMSSCWSPDTSVLNQLTVATYWSRSKQLLKRTVWIASLNKNENNFQDPTRIICLQISHRAEQVTTHPAKREFVEKK